MEENQQKKQPDPYPDEPQPYETCVPFGAAPATTKPYWYVVQPEDLGSFWAIPTKFRLPARKGDGWTWHELRNANLDWPGGFVKQGDACVLQGLTPGARLHVPGHWPEPKPGVKTVPKKGAKPARGTATAALVVGIVGAVGIAGLTWMAWRSK